MLIKLIKYTQSRIRIIYNKVYFIFIKLIISKKVEFGKIIFFKGFVFDLSGQNFKINIGCVTFKEDCTIRLRKNGNLFIGDNVFFNRGCSVNCLDRIHIGRDTLFGENVKIYDHNHKFRDKNELIREQDYSLGGINIGNNCWIGSNVVILKGVTIGDNVIIGANSLIYKDINCNCVVKNENVLIIESRR